MRHIVLAEIYMVQKTGLPMMHQYGMNRARKLVSLNVQGMKIEDEDGHSWEIGTVMHVDSMEMLGKRAVCAEEGHVLPEVIKTRSFGCKRCDYVFTGQVGHG